MEWINQNQKQLPSNINIGTSSMTGNDLHDRIAPILLLISNNIKLKGNDEQEKYVMRNQSTHVGDALCELLSFFIIYGLRQIEVDFSNLLP